MSAATTGHLKREHEQIEEVLGAFERYLELSKVADQGPDRHELWGLLDCLSENLLIKHEEKEETVLLPELFRHGLSWSDGTLAHVRQEHRHGRYLMRSLRQACHQTLEWSRDDRRHFLAVGREWIDFLRHHMQQEEALLFPFLDRDLDADQDRQLTREFEAIDFDFSTMPDARSLSESRLRFVEKYRAA